MENNLNTAGVLSPWIVVDKYCATRVLVGTNPDLVENRVAFIEKTPRVRVAAFTDKNLDYQNWESGPKGSGGNLEEDGETIYGFYGPSREWCDERLVELGYTLG